MRGSVIVVYVVEWVGGLPILCEVGGPPIIEFRLGGSPVVVVGGEGWITNIVLCGWVGHQYSRVGVSAMF